MGAKLKDVPELLKGHYIALNKLIKDGEMLKAEQYLYSLPQKVYDEIVKRSGRGYSFETIVNKIEGIRIAKRTNETFKINEHSGDKNFIF
jgi:hypothetical protein